MQFKLFGYTIGSGETKPKGLQQYVTPSFTEPTFDLTSNGFLSPTATSFQLASAVKTENEAIAQYRDIAREPEVDLAIEEIICEMLVFDHDADVISLNMDNIEYDENIKDTINEEFKTILGLLDFNTNGHNIAKRWYIDGRINYLISINNEMPQYGIQQLQYIEPQKIKRIRDIEKKIQDGHSVVKKISEYYLYSETGVDFAANMAPSLSGDVLKLTVDAVVHCNSGLYDTDRGFVISQLDTAIKAVNSLRTIEDSTIIYNMTRAPERRIFYIDTGNLPKAKAEQYVKEIADKHRTKIMYDPNTGKVRNEKRFMAMTEDFWIPRSNGGRGTEIDTLPGGDAFSNMDIADYFRNKLWDALKVPASRFQQGTFFQHGTEITRDELRFHKYIGRLRSQFNGLFEQLLKQQLILKGIISIEDWEYFRDNVKFVYAVDNYFAEAVETEILQSRINTLNLVDPYVGKYFGNDYVYKKILKIHDEEIETLQQDATQTQESNIQKQVQLNMLEQQLQGGLPPDQEQPTK